MKSSLWTKPYETRRAFIGGSDARIIMGTDETALLRLWREKRGEAEPEDLSANLIVQLGAATENLKPHLVRTEHGPAHFRRPAARQAFSHSMDGGDPRWHRGGVGGGVRGEVHVALVILRGGGRRKVHGPAPAQHVGHPFKDLGTVDHHRRRQMGRDHRFPWTPLSQRSGLGGKEVLALRPIRRAAPSDQCRAAASHASRPSASSI